jgi:hypothetical protein
MGEICKGTGSQGQLRRGVGDREENKAGIELGIPFYDVMGRVFPSSCTC